MNYSDLFEAISGAGSDYPVSMTPFGAVSFLQRKGIDPGTIAPHASKYMGADWSAEFNFLQNLSREDIKVLQSLGMATVEPCPYSAE